MPPQHLRRIIPKRAYAVPLASAYLLVSSELVLLGAINKSRRVGPDEGSLRPICAVRGSVVDMSSLTDLGMIGRPDSKTNS